MNRITVEEVERLPLAVGELYGFQLEGPAADTAAQALYLDGWVLGRESPVRAVEVLQEGRPILRVKVHVPRPDVAAAFPDAVDADRAGFTAAIGAPRLRNRFELLVRAELEGGVMVPLATVAGRREPLALPAPAGPQPLILTTLGRTGSTWCVWTLQSHPEIVAHSPFDNDARVGAYWMSALQTLAEPTSYLRQVFPGEVNEADGWVGGEADIPARLNNAALDAWLAGDRIDELAATCRDRIDSFYEFLAEQQDKGARFFVEKFLPRQISVDLLRELYPGAAEVVLVRDLRDVFCSILAFNRKRGYHAFGRELAASDDEYIYSVQRSGEALLDHMRDGRETHLLRYEDLITAPVETLEPLLEFLGLDPAGAAAMVETAAVSTRAMDHHMTAPSASASIGRWRTDLEPELAERCDAILAPVVAEFGYATAGEDSPAAV
ncbi:MAG: sulfotransferase [Actinobacteria bacterium]|nr:sulfotransferase [Actinomycetota bacterium]